MTVEVTLSTDGRWDLGMPLPCGHFLMQRLSWCTAGSCLVTRAAGAEFTVARSFLQPWGYLGKPLLPCGIVSPHPGQRLVLPQLNPEKDWSLSLLLFSFPFMQPVLGKGIP